MSRNRGTRSSERNPRQPVQPGAFPPKLNGLPVLEGLFGRDQMIPFSNGNNGNAGLVFDRYLRVWDRDGQIKLIDKERALVLKLFADQYKKCGTQSGSLLKDIDNRLQSLCEQLAGDKIVLTTRERFVTGLGASHPLDNGIAFDYSLGVPFLPGSSVKGLARCYSEYELDQSRIDELFGPDEDGKADDHDRKVGDLIFFAAYPEKWPELDVDVINCHYPEYYASKPIVASSEGATVESPSRKPASDSEERVKNWVGPIEYESPVPVFFLTVAKGASFVFRCGSRNHNSDNAREGLRLIRHGLAEFGIGAKTALGYGVMEQ